MAASVGNDPTVCLGSICTSNWQGEFLLVIFEI